MGALHYILPINIRLDNDKLLFEGFTCEIDYIQQTY